MDAFRDTVTTLGTCSTYYDYLRHAYCSRTRTATVWVKQETSWPNFLLTREDDGEDELSDDPKRRKTMDLYMKEREGKPNADCQYRSPMPSTSAEPSSSPWGQARPTGAGEADRGKRGRWGQARLVGAGETGGGRQG